MESLDVATYCLNWNSADRRPGRPISESRARKLDSEGSPYLVALGAGEDVRTLVSVHWALDFLAVWFLDEAKLRYLKYSFKRVEPGTLFMNEVTMWEYPEGADGGLNSATKVTNLHYQPDGIVTETISDSDTETVDTISRSDVPLDINWEPVPEFGDWARVSRYNREA